MKKKLLSLLLVLAMALTLMPTVALAANAFTVTITAGRGTQSGATLPVNWTVAVQKSTDGGTAAEDKATELTSLLGTNFTVKLEKAGATTPLDSKTVAVENEKYDYSVNLTIPEGTQAANDYKVTVSATAGSPADGTVNIVDTAGVLEDQHLDAVPVPTQIAAVEAQCDTDPVTAGGNVEFSVVSVNGDANLKDVVKLGTVTWKSGGNPVDPAPAAGKAPAEAGTYSVEIVVTVAPDSTGSYEMGENVKATIASITVDDATPTPDVCNHTRTEITENKPANCGNAGYNLPSGTAGVYYCDTCKKYFDAATGGTDVTASIEVVPATGAHTVANWTTDQTSHSGTCTTCSQAVSGNHNTSGTDGACSVCGYKAATNPPAPTTPASLDITAAMISSDGKTLNVNWTYTPASSAPTTAKAAAVPTFNILMHPTNAIGAEGSYVHEWTFAGVTGTSTGNNTYTFTDSLSRATKNGNPAKAAVTESGSYTVWVISADSGNASDTHVVHFTAPAAPAVSSNTVTAVEDQIDKVTSSTDVADVQDAILSTVTPGANETRQEALAGAMTADTSASRNLVSEVKKLEKAIVKAKGLSVVVSTESDSTVSVVKDTVVGLALNEPASKNTTAIDFSLGEAVSSHGAPSGAKVLYPISASVSGLKNPKNLEFPVQFGVDVSGCGFDSTKPVKVIHYGSKQESCPAYFLNKYTVIITTTGFSDFMIYQTEGTGSSSSGHRGGGSSASGNYGSGTVVNTPVTVTPAKIFTDVPANHTFASQITWARDNSVMGGYSDGSFRPGNPTNRQQMWMVLARLAGENPADMAAAREWAISAGISDGTNPEGTMSRQQLITMLYRFAQSQNKAGGDPADLSGYPDSGAVASYAKEALAWGVGNGIITGTGEGKLNPEGSATRAHFAAFLYRYSHMA